MLMVGKLVQQCSLTANANIKLWFAEPKLPIPIYHYFGIGTAEACARQAADTMELFHKMTGMVITADVDDNHIRFFLHCPESIARALKGQPL
jgi:hypothetical protein